MTNREPSGDRTISRPERFRPPTRMVEFAEVAVQIRPGIDCVSLVNCSCVPIMSSSTTKNVQPNSLAGPHAEHFRVPVFVRANQNKLTFEIASAIQKLGPRAEYVRIAGNGANALDFHIAFHIGILAAQDPTASFTSFPKTRASIRRSST